MKQSTLLTHLPPPLNMKVAKQWCHHAILVINKKNCSMKHPGHHRITWQHASLITVTKESLGFFLQTVSLFPSLLSSICLPVLDTKGDCFQITLHSEGEKQVASIVCSTTLPYICELHSCSEQSHLYCHIWTTCRYWALGCGLPRCIQYFLNSKQLLTHALTKLFS